MVSVSRLLVSVSVSKALVSVSMFLVSVSRGIVGLVAGNALVSVSCIRYSKRRKFRREMCQNAFGSRAPLGPAGVSSVSAQSGPLGGSDPDAVWDGRSGGSRNELGSGVVASVNEKSNFVSDYGANSGNFASIRRHEQTTKT